MRPRRSTPLRGEDDESLAMVSRGERGAVFWADQEFAYVFDGKDEASGIVVTPSPLWGLPSSVQRGVL